jgi:hypothetical protein
VEIGKEEVKAQKLSSQIKNHSLALGTLALVCLGAFSQVSVAQNYLWRGQERCELTANGIANCQVVDPEVAASAAIERFSNDRLPSYGSHDEDCEENRDPILDWYLHEVDIVGDDGRDFQDQNWRPYVASVSNLVNGVERVRGSSFMPHQRVIVTTAHHFVNEDRWYETWSEDRPDASLWQRGYRARVAGCEAQGPIAFHDICRIGTTDVSSEPGLDYAVIMLSEESCLDDSQLAYISDLSDNAEVALTRPDTLARVSTPAFIDPRSRGTDTGGGSGAQTRGVTWPVDDVALMEDTNRLVEIRHFIHSPSGYRRVSADYSGPETVYKEYLHHADGDQGTSGAPLVLSYEGVEVLGDVIGLQTAEIDGPREGNFALAIEGQFAADIEAVVNHARSGGTGCP